MKTKVILLFVVYFCTAYSVFAQKNGNNGRENNSNPNILQIDNFVKPLPVIDFVSDRDNQTKDNVVADDQIVIGSLGVGMSVVENENFGFNTILLKENNLRIRFEDDSEGAFPANDWTLIANESGSGGANYFAIQDGTAAVIPFMLMAGAPSNALYVANTGKIGFSTATPLLSLHANDSNTPGLRLEQNTTTGWSAYVWDIAGNESNFFIRDVTGGSSLPFRIKPGAPTNSLSISNTGFVGIGTYTPTHNLDVNGSMKLTALTVAPTTLLEGVMYMDATDHYLKYYNGTSLQTVSDKQNLVAATLTGTILQIDIENGTSVSVDLQPLISDLESRVTALEAQVGIKNNDMINAVVSQNVPNPYKTETSISYFIPAETQKASIVIYNINGLKINEYPINERGNGSLKISGNNIETGTFFYTLVLDGKKLESKIMIRIE